MKLENQVCTFEQAKKLKELGIEQKTLFQWKHNDTQTVVIETPMAMWIEKYVPPIGNKYYAAFTLSELSIMLPSETYIKRTGSEDSEYTNWEWIDEGNEAGWGNYNTQVEAAADMLIIYLEKNKLPVETCNERLVA